MSTAAQKAAARRKVLPGFPVTESFSTPEQLEEYFGGSKIVCLRCGKKYRTLGVHLKASHEMELDEYKEIYGIPWTYGLSCAETTQLHSDEVKRKLESGEWVPSAERAKLARESLSLQRKRQPVRDVLSLRNLEKMNDGKTGEYTAKLKLMSKRGSAEFKAKMRERPQMEQAKKMLASYWKGKEQTDEHVFNRTGSHKKVKK